MTSTRSRLLLIDQKSSETGRGHIEADSVSSRVGSGQGLGRVGDGPGSRWGRLRVKSGRVESGSGSSRRRIGVVLGPTPFQVGWGRVRVWMESGTGRGRVWVPVVSDQSRRCFYLLGVTSFQHEGGPHIEGPPQNQCKCLSLRVKSQREAESMAIH